VLYCAIYKPLESKTFKIEILIKKPLIKFFEVYSSVANQSHDNKIDLNYINNFNTNFYP
jgi:hypothetical protein